MRPAIWAAATASALACLAGVARADTIDFSQFQPDGAFFPNVLTGTTVGGVGFTLTGNGNGFKRVTANTSDWVNSQFPAGDPLLFDAGPMSYGPGPVTIDFSSPISSITGLAAESDVYGPYTATLTAFDGSTLLGVSSYSATGLITSSPNTLPAFSFSSPAITSISLDTSTDSGGFAIGSVPEPASWAMMLVGLGALGVALRHNRPKKVVAAA